MSTRDSDRGGPSAGFSLAEVLLAIFLLGMLSVGVSALLGQLVSGNDQNLSRFQSRAQAVAVMESLLTREYADLPVGFSSDAGNGASTWTLEISQDAPSLRRLVVVSTTRDETCQLETLVADRFGGSP